MQPSLVTVRFHMSLAYQVGPGLATRTHRRGSPHYQRACLCDARLAYPADDALSMGNLVDSLPMLIMSVTCGYSQVSMDIAH